MAYRDLAVDGKKRNKQMLWRTSSEFSKEIKEFVKTAKFTDIDGRERTFASYSDFNEFVMRILIDRGAEGWTMLAEQKLRPRFW
jgi:hypothetical protein